MPLGKRVWGGGGDNLRKAGTPSEDRGWERNHTPPHSCLGVTPETKKEQTKSSQKEQKKQL